MHSKELTQGIMLNYSTDLTQLQSMLQAGVAVFYYAKKAKEGEEPVVRRAVGTLAPHMLPTYKTAHVEALIQASATICNDLLMVMQNPSLLQDSDPIAGRLEQCNKAIQPFLPKEGVAKKKAEHLTSYFDLEAGDWRSFTTENFKAVLV